MNPPSGSTRHCANAGAPLASMRTRCEPAHSAPGPCSQMRYSSAPLHPQRVRRHLHRGVFVQQRDERLDVESFERVDVAREQLLLVGVDRFGARRATVTLCSASVERARCNALFTETTVVSSSSATSVAFHFNTSRRINTARCRAGRSATRRRTRAGPIRESRPPRPGRRVRDDACDRERARATRSPLVGAVDRRVGVTDRHDVDRAARAACGSSTCRSTRCSRCGTATNAAQPDPRTGRSCATRAPTSPAPRRRPRMPEPSIR